RFETPLSRRAGQMGLLHREKETRHPARFGRSKGIRGNESAELETRYPRSARTRNRLDHPSGFSYKKSNYRGPEQTRARKIKQGTRRNDHWKTVAATEGHDLF